ncbi:hypothetical protein MMC24_005188 [Lignoscripta atroalba]|nr:hypothetical protein [Lignoscripta atroalba]
MPFIKIALVGATGTLGKQILGALQASRSPSFEISILTRGDSTPPDLPTSTHVVKVDYSNHSQLTKAFVGQDALISAVPGTSTPPIDQILLDAAISAGVSRFFSSEYTLDVCHPASRAIATPIVLGPRIALADRLEEEGRRGSIEWTTIVPGGFLDWALDTGFAGFDVKERKVTLYDGGKHPASGCTLPFIASVVVAALKMPRDATKNKRIRVSETTYTGLEMLKLLEQATGEKFEVENVSTDESLTRGRESLDRGDIAGAYQGFLLKLNYDGEGTGFFEEGLGHSGDGTLERKGLQQIVVEAVSRDRATKAV